MKPIASWLAVAFVFHANLVMIAQESSASSLTCAVGEPDGREFLLDRAEGRWRLSMRSTATGNPWIRLMLPNAAPEIADGAARLAYRNANGGRQVDLTVSAGRSSLDIWVDYGLEVNVEPDLDPRVDHMNTEGPLPNVTCKVLGSTPD
jgi:hypothetical protein